MILARMCKKKKTKKIMKDWILTSTDPQLWKDMMDEGTGILWTQQALTGLLQVQVSSTRSVTFSQLSEATILLMISFKRRLNPGGRIMTEDENSAGKQEHSTSSNQTLGSGWLLPPQGHWRHFLMSRLLGSRASAGEEQGSIREGQSGAL